MKYNQGRFQNLYGRVFGDRTVLSLASRGRKGEGCKWQVRCVCGREDSVLGYHLLSGNANRCINCARRRASQWGKTRTTHGYSRQGENQDGTPEYKIWTSMKSRCSNPNNPSYKYYGGRGIKVCERWQFFENFLADMGARPATLSLDRINTNGDYTPNNCRWATHHEQQLNRRKYQAIEHYTTEELIAEIKRRGLFDEVKT